jgi:hypothetical protein
MLGHTSAAITLDTYADLFDDDLDYVAEALSRARHTQNTIILPESPYAGPAGHRPPSNGGEITRSRTPQTGPSRHGQIARKCAPRA